MHKKPIYLAILCLILIGIISPGAKAQSDTSSLSGTVSDPSGAVVPNAKITVHKIATGSEQILTTNENGNYNLPNAQTGIYTVRIEATGFGAITLNDVHIDPSIGRRVDVTLKAGDVTANVTVEASANTVQTESASVGQLVTQEQVKNIQLNGRNPLYLSQLEPGVVRGNSMAAFAFGLDNGINVNGARSQESLITFDGAPMVRTRSNGTSVGVADVDSTSQVQILTTSYPAEYGRTSGGQVRIVPKSGASDYHGSLFEYFRNNALNANTWGRNFSGLGRAAFRYNQFGWNFNGPVFIPGHFNADRQKLFFLIGQEYVRYNHDDTATQKTPTALMRQGNFSELLSTNIFYSTPVQIVNPTTGTPYANNIITSPLSANGVGLLTAYPLPNTSAPGYNWIDSALYTEKQRKDTIIVDYIPFEKHRIRFSLLNYNYKDYEPHYGNFNRNPRIFNRPNQVAVFHYTWAINASTVNERHRLCRCRSRQHRHRYLLSAAMTERKYGINYPYLYDGSANKVLTEQNTYD